MEVAESYHRDAPPPALESPACGPPIPETAPIRVDVKDTGEAYTVIAELAGVKKEDIHVEVEGNEVTISAETRQATGRKLAIS